MSKTYYPTVEAVETIELAEEIVTVNGAEIHFKNTESARRFVLLLADKKFPVATVFYGGAKNGTVCGMMTAETPSDEMVLISNFGEVIAFGELKKSVNVVIKMTQYSKEK